MKAIVKQHPSRGLTFVENAPIPEPKAGEVQVKITHTAICGSDLHIYQWNEWAQNTLSPPVTVGHEFVGQIAKLGPGVKGWQVGERVSGEGHLVCEKCRNCRAGKRHLCIRTQGIGIHTNGAFAEFMCIPATNLYRIPPAIPNNIAAMLDPFGNAVHTALAFPVIGEDILITGAGPIGIMAGLVAQHTGARHVVITDIQAERLKLAHQLGIPHAVHSDSVTIQAKMKELGIQSGFDVGFEMSGNSQAIEVMLQHMHHGSSIALLGVASGKIQLNLNEIVFKSISLRGIYGREIFETWYKMIAMLEGGLDISSLITHELAAKNFEQGISLLEQGKALKVILTWET
ncbi:MAG: L-threonine 3-dehydrogenase [Zetaproteobacteria bacterium]|nr:L-threonine 3-dehydrogenase [Zetaproteobacteria bacterium]